MTKRWCHCEEQDSPFYSEQAPRSLVSNPNIEILKFKVALVNGIHGQVRPHN